MIARPIARPNAPEPMPRVLRSGGPDAAPAAEPDRRAGVGANALVGTGLVLLLVAVLHVTLIWIPSHLGVASWEFAAASQTVDVFPLAITGTGILAWVVLQRGWRRRALLLSAWCGLSAVLLLGVVGLILLDLPVAWTSVTEEMRGSLIKAGGKALGLGVVFTLYFGWLAVLLARSRRD